MAFFFIYACKENVAGKAKIKRKKEVNNHCVYNLSNYNGSRLQLERISFFSVLHSRSRSSLAIKWIQRNSEAYIPFYLIQLLSNYALFFHRYIRRSVVQLTIGLLLDVEFAVHIRQNVCITSV